MVVPWIAVLVVDVFAVTLAYPALADHHASDLVTGRTVLLVLGSPVVLAVLFLVVPRGHGNLQFPQRRQMHSTFLAPLSKET